ncbi:MAG: hypothetical protein H6934_07700 [Burkholderiaceae bacterium]|nr:hypothetical protein [Burkholderiaceae bacterium]
MISRARGKRWLARLGAGLAVLAVVGAVVLAIGDGLGGTGLAVAAPAASAPAASSAQTGSRVPRPVLEIDRGPDGKRKCIAPVEEMRRNHMKMLHHQRDRTMRQGIRGGKASLNDCIACHATPQATRSGSTDAAIRSVLGSPDGFCQSCHAYAAVKLDCFECHQARTASPAQLSGAAK